MAMTMIPIPPSHCNKDLQTKIPLDAFSISGKIVEPVVVMPDTLSKKASVKDKSRDEKYKGNAPKKQIDNQAKLVIKNACWTFNDLSFVWLINTNKVPMKADKIPVTKKCWDLSPIVISTICGTIIKPDKMIIR